MKKILHFVLLLIISLLCASPSSAQKNLIHYWNFNTLAGPYIHPNIPHIMPDYPAGDTAYLEYYLLPGTSATWAISGPDANNASGAQIDNVAGDTTNARLSAVAGTGIRFRNPTDSAELHWHIPSTGFSNLVVKFATQTSSVASGDSVQDYSYSIDGGKTWDNTGMTVNGAPGHTLDLTQGGNATTIYLSFSAVTVTFGSTTTVNNNPNLIFRIVFQGNTHPGFPVTGTNQVSGNNRFDNFTVDGDGASKGPPASIIITNPRATNLLVAGRSVMISFDTADGVAQSRTIEFSPDGGTTWGPVGNISGLTSYSWMVPNTPTTNGMIRVTDAIGTVAISGKFFIISVDAKTNRIIHYWDFNGLTGAYNNPNIPAFPADFSANASAPGSIIYTLAAGAPSNYSGYIDNVAGDLGNAQFGEPAGNAMRVRNPTDMVELHFKIPTTGFKNISFSYVIEESSNVSPLTRHFDYSVDGGTTWITTGLNMLTESNLDSTKYDPVTVTFASGSAAENSANLIFRIKMTGGLNTGTSGNNRYDNIVVEGDPTANAVAEVAAGSVQPTINPNPATDHITIGTARTGLKTIAVIDITGKTVLESKEIGQDIRLSTATLASGIYTVQITDEVTGKLNTIKFVKE